MFLPTTTRKHDAELPSIAMNEQALKQKQWSALSCLKSQTLRGECELLSHSVTHCNRGIIPACTMLAMDCVALPILKSWDMSNQPSGFVITYHVWQKTPNRYRQKPINIEIICIISIIIEIQVVQINKHRINREHTPLKKDPCIANADLES